VVANIFKKVGKEYFQGKSSPVADSRVRTRREPGSPAGAMQLHLEGALPVPPHAALACAGGQQSSEGQKPG